MKQRAIVLGIIAVVTVDSIAHAENKPTEDAAERLARRWMGHSATDKTVSYDKWLAAACETLRIRPQSDEMLAAFLRSTALKSSSAACVAPNARRMCPLVSTLFKSPGASATARSASGFASFGRPALNRAHARLL
jgi:hypothetical protein